MNLNMSFNIIRGGGVYDHLMSMRIFTLIMDELFI